jgi:membrane protease YdiL (CAAX protease family)
MKKKSKVTALAPLFTILLFSIVIYSLRYLDDLNQYNRNLLYALPVLGILYLFIFFTYLRQEKLVLSTAGFKTSRLKQTASIILGFAGGIFFFMIYFGAHPNRGFPSWPEFVAFNIYFLFIILTDELVFRVWVLHSFRKAFSRGWALALSALTYMLANLATMGRDLSSVVSGRIDLFLIIETVGRTFFIGLILAGIYSLTKSIYGNLVFISISNIPILYEIEGPVFQSNPISAAISALGCIIFIFLVISHVRAKKKAPAQPMPEQKVITS